MLSPELRIQDMDPEHWANLMRAMHPPPGGDPQPELWGPLGLLARATAREPEPEASTALSPRMPALVLLRGGRVLRIVIWGGGPLAATELPASELSSVGPAELRALAERHRLPFIVALETTVLPELWAEVQSAISPGEDYVAQGLAAARVLREALGKTVFVEPRVMGLMPLPSYPLLQATLNQILPDDRSVVFYLVDQGRVWTSLIVVKRAGDICLLTSHAAIADRVQFSSIRSDAPTVLRAVGERFAPAQVGIFLPLRVWHELIAGDRSAVARAIANRQALLDPAPPWLLALVGVGAMAEAATRSVRLAGKLLSASRLGSKLLPLSDTAERLVQTVTSPLEALGLDPWELLRWSRDWARRLALDREKLGGK